MQPQQSQADSKDVSSHSKTSDDSVSLSNPLATQAASKQPAGHDGAAPDSASTVAWADLQIPMTPSDNPVWIVQSGSPQVGQQHARQQDDLIMSQGRHRSAAGQASSQAGAVLPSIDATPPHFRCRLQRRLSLGDSPIDLLTPSTGAASTVATPNFSECSEVCDLTQS